VEPLTVILSTSGVVNEPQLFLLNNYWTSKYHAVNLSALHTKPDTYQQTVLQCHNVHVTNTHPSKSIRSAIVAT